MSATLQATDTSWMRQALTLAKQALYLSDPNPRVGCVLVSPQNECIGQGYTQAVGGPHAEVMALRDAAQRSHSTKGATAYVTLEPCSHHGRTPPCADALITAGITRVVIAATDPNPLVQGRGIERLRASGVTVVTGCLDTESEELNIGFFSRMQRGLPWVRLKTACSLDGKTALENGQSQWITGEAARADSHTWRARASVVLTGIGTILADDPKLNVRSIQTPRQPWHAIADTSLRTPPTAALFHSSPRVLIYTANTDETRRKELEAVGAVLITAPLCKRGHIDLHWMLQNLARHECNELHVEAGSTLSSALLITHLADELLLYMAPRLIGNGRALLTGFHPHVLSETLDFQYTDITQIGTDARLIARRTQSV